MILFSKMKIYTKTGDGGMTALFNGLRVKKSHKIIEALGAIDELNAWLGILKLTDIQKDLMVIASQIAGYKNNKMIVDSHFLEKEIDRMQKSLPELRNFILPTGQIHLVRAVCRRAERRINFLKNKNILQYMNRLSDYLFVLARWKNFKKKEKEILWYS